MRAPYPSFNPCINKLTDEHSSELCTKRTHSLVTHISYVYKITTIY
jgi:hypothetical protein